MAKFKVGDKVERFNSNHCGMSVGDTGTIKKIDCPCDMVCLEEYRGEHDENNIELVKGAKKMKKEKRNYIVVNSDCDNVEHSRLLTKDEAIEKVTSDNYYMLDISKAPRYTKKTTSRMVLQKGAK